MLVSLLTVCCITDVSQRIPNFVQNWNSIESGLRMEILEIVKIPFCAMGYDRMLQEAVGHSDEIRDICKNLLK